MRRALYPVVGESTLRDLVREAKANEAAFRARVRTVLRSSHSNHYRRMLPRLLAALDFRCNNSAYVMPGSRAATGMPSPEGGFGRREATRRLAAR